MEIPIKLHGLRVGVSMWGLVLQRKKKGNIFTAQHTKPKASIPEIDHSALPIFTTAL